MTDPPEREEAAEPEPSVPPQEGPSPKGSSRGEPPGEDPAGTADGSGAADAPRQRPARRPQRQRKQVLLRLDPAIYDAIARWAAEELRSSNAQIDYLLRKALADARRLPGNARPHPPRGRPPRDE